MGTVAKCFRNPEQKVSALRGEEVSSFLESIISETYSS
jgi:hypothetical protein